MSENIEDKITGNLTKVMSLSVGETDVMWLIRHNTGLGVHFKYLVCYVFRNKKFLGSFEVQEKITPDAVWIPSHEHDMPASEAEVSNFRKVRTMMIGLSDKAW